MPIMLSGVEEIECGDVSKRRVQAGDILPVDDTVRQGPIARDSADCRSIFIALPEGFVSNFWRAAEDSG